MAEKIVQIENESQLSAIFGQLDSNISHIEKQYNVGIINRDGNVKIIGNETDVTEAARAVQALIKMNSKKISTTAFCSCAYLHVTIILTFFTSTNHFFTTDCFDMFIS